MEFWLSISFTFIGVALSLFIYITKKEKHGAIIAIIISFLIASVSFLVALKNNYKPDSAERTSTEISSDTTSKNQNDKSAQDIFDSNMFSNYFETHNSKNNNINCELSSWNYTNDKDITGSYHEYENGFKLYAGRYFYINDYSVTSDIHLIYNKNYNNNSVFSGKIVVGSMSSGTKSTAEVSILMDGEEVWKTKEKITGLTINPIEFSIDTKNCKEEVIIRTNFYILDSSLILGIFSDSFFNN